MGRREENKQAKRQRLEREGLRLFLEAGYDRTSIEQIAAASEVARGTYYLYFADKHALFATLMERWFDLHLYLANWGTRRLMMRLPKRLVDRERLESFLADIDWVEVWERGENATCA